MSKSIWAIFLGVPRFQNEGRVLDQIVADRDDQIGLQERLEHVVLALQADGEQAVRIIQRHRPLAHEGVDHGYAGLARQPSQLLAGTLSDRTVAGEDQRAFGLGDQLDHPRHRLVVGARPAGADGAHRRQIDRPLGDILGQLDDTGAGLFGMRQLERLSYDLRHRLLVANGRRPLGDRPHHGNRIHVLVALLVQPGGRALADNADQRGSVHVGIGNAGHQIGRPRPQRRQTDPGLAGQPAIDIRHEGGGLLVPAKDEIDRTVHQRQHDIGVLLARHAENVGDTLGLQTADEQIGRLDGGHAAVSCDGAAQHMASPLEG